MRRIGLVLLVWLSGCSVLNTLLVPQRAARASSGSVGASALIDPAAVTVSDGRLYFNAWTKGVRDGVCRATLSGPGVAAEAVSFERPPFESPSCVGVSVARGSVNLVPSCSFEVTSASVGSHVLTVTIDGRTAAEHRFELVPARNVDGSTALAVSMAARTGHAVLSQYGLTAWVPVDVRDPVVALSAVWFRDGAVVHTTRGLARGPFLDGTDGPAQELVGVDLRTEGAFKRSSLEVVLVKEGAQPLAQFHVRPEDLDVIGTGGRVVLKAAALEERLTGLALAAARRSVDGLAALDPPQFRAEVSEPVACAVITSPEARTTYRRLMRARANQQSAMASAAEARAEAYGRAVSQQQREALLQQALAAENGAENDQREQTQLRRELERFTRAQRSGCFAMLLGTP